MQGKILVKSILSLAVAQLCYASIIRESLDTRLCRAQFVFKFQVVSASRKVCYSPQTRTTTESLPTTTTAQTTTAATTKATTTAATTKTTTTKALTTKTITANSTLLTNATLHRKSNLTTVTPTNPVHISTTQSTNSTILNQTTVSPPKNRRKRCIRKLLHQNIIIEKNSVFQGHDKLKKIRAVKEIEIKDISYSAYHSYIQLDLNFQTDLLLGEYLFIGRHTPDIDIKYQVFLKNPSTVVPWSKSLEQKLNKFDFVKDCKKQKKVRLSH